MATHCSVLTLLAGFRSQPSCFEVFKEYIK
jgi:hypothetical protein